MNNTEIFLEGKEEDRATYPHPMTLRRKPQRSSRPSKRRRTILVPIKPTLFDHEQRLLRLEAQIQTFRQMLHLQTVEQIIRF